MQPRPANAFKLSLEADDLVIEFGNVRQPGATSAAGVAVSDRVILPADIGRRLVHWLEDALRPHAASLRAEEAKALSPAAAAVAARPGAAAARPFADEAGGRAAQLLRLVGDLGVPHQYERSFRMCRRAVLANRFLLTLDAADIAGNACERTLEICDRLQMPGAARAAAEANFAAAKSIHFGFEADDDSTICKLYLERAVPAEEAARARADRTPVLLHLAFKWDLVKAAAVTTRYWWHPALCAAEIEERLAHVYRDGPQASLEIARAVLALTRDRVATEQLQYLEVEEAENPRRSFDLNLYDAKLQVKDMQALLFRMRDHFGVRPGQLQALYDQIKTKALGHLAGGVHRNGEDFFNVYYGVVGLAGGPRAQDAQALRTAAAGAPPSQAAAAPSPDERSDRAEQLMRMVGALGVPHQYERSFRLRERAIQTNRFLLTVDAQDIPGDPVARTLEICDGLLMPPAAREAAAANFAMAKCVHFGFEADERGSIGKLYLEREVPADEAERARGEPVLLGLAFKWDLAKAEAVTGRYWWYPALSAAEIVERLARIYQDKQRASFEIACAALALTKNLVDANRLQYLEVEEAENVRRSFDLNLYRAKLQVKDMQALLYRMREHFALRPGQLQALYDQIKGESLGILGGGVHRNGEDFFTIYYGAVGLPHFHSKFR